MSSEDQAASQAAGYSAFLPKPISWPQLATLLEKHLHLEWSVERAAADEHQAGAGGDLPPLPMDEATIIYKLALHGDMRGIQGRAAALAAHDEQLRPIADRLRQLAASFADDDILALLERYRERAP
jgi:hypothetical protein